MAKVTGPLYSMSASGKLADAMVFFGWKGVNVVRGWVKPANPQSDNQGDRRIVMGGTGRAVGKIDAGKAFAQQLIDLGLIPNGQTKQSYLVKYIIDNFISTPALYTAMLSALTNHTGYSGFLSAADALTISEYDLDYANVAAYDRALGLYLIARAAIALGFTGTPYSLALASWISTSVNSMISDFTKE